MDTSSVIIDMAQNRNVSGLKIAQRYSSAVPDKMQIFFSTNGTDWTTAGDPLVTKKKSTAYIGIAPITTARYIKLQVTKSSTTAYQMNDVTVYTK